MPLHREPPDGHTSPVAADAEPLADPNADRPQGPRVDDAALVAAARNGDETAFAMLYERHAGPIHDYCSGQLRSAPAEVDDTVQETFAIAWQHVDQLREPERFRSWLYVIGGRQAARRRRNRLQVTPISGLVESERVDQPDEQTATPEAAALNQDRVELVRAALQGLDPADRLLLQLHLGGLVGADLARALAVSPNHAAVRLHRAKTRLRDAVGVVLLSRQRSGQCDRLAGFLEDWDGTMNSLLRKRVLRHVQQCAGCDASMRRVSTAESVLGLVMVLVAPVALQRELAAEVAAHGVLGPVVPEGTVLSGAAAAENAVSVSTAEVSAGGPSNLVSGWFTPARSVAAAVAGLVMTTGLVLVAPAPVQELPRSVESAPQSVPDTGERTAVSPQATEAEGPVPPAPADTEAQEGAAVTGHGLGDGEVVDAPEGDPAAAAVPVCPPGPTLSGMMRRTAAPGSLSVAGDRSTALFFPERSSYPLPRDLWVDPDGTGPEGMVLVPAGTRVDSWVVHARVPGHQRGDGGTRYRGQVNTGTQVLGLIWGDAHLDATDGLLGADGTAYPTGQEARGLETRDDRVLVGAGRRQVTVDMSVGSVSDTFRIVTESAPPGCAP